MPFKSVTVNVPGPRRIDVSLAIAAFNSAYVETSECVVVVGKSGPLLVVTDCKSCLFCPVSNTRMLYVVLGLMSPLMPLAAKLAQRRVASWHATGSAIRVHAPTVPLSFNR